MEKNKLEEIMKSVDVRMLSALARGLAGSEILKIAAEVRELVASGREVCNLTVGDFDPEEFPLPEVFLEEIKKSYDDGNTNYPPANGVPELREAIRKFVKRELGLDYPSGCVLVAAGARPLIYGAYRILVDPGDIVVFPVPSWNNNHYTYLSGGIPFPVEVLKENDFHPVPEDLNDVIGKARLIALCSPANPTGTSMKKEVMEKIAHAVVAENENRLKKGARPLYLLFDMVYWALDFVSGECVTPVSLVPEVAPYTVLIDAVSKSLSATGVRIGWSLAPQAITLSMADLLTHIGAWAPRAEQIALARFLERPELFRQHRNLMKERLLARLKQLYNGLMALARKGYPVDAVEPCGTLYVSARFELFGEKTALALKTSEEIRKLILQEAGIAMIPFQAFGLQKEDGWFRLSVGAVSGEAISKGLEQLEKLFERICK